MARIRWQGSEYTGEPVEQRDGGWTFKMHQHGPRWAKGSVIFIDQKNILEMAAAETPIMRDAGIAALEHGMVHERETLPTVQELIKGARAEGTVVNPKPVEENANG